jgi:hypothetical protein
MYTAMVGINVYSSSRNLNYFSVLAGLSDVSGEEVRRLIMPSVELPFSSGKRAGVRRAASLRTAIKTKTLRIIFAGRLGSAPAVTTLPTANNRNVFIISLLIA